MTAAAEQQQHAIERLRQLGEGGPRLYSRWSERAWRLVCEGPGLRLWDAIAGTPGAEQTLEDYLLLAREAVGLQYVTANEPADLAPGLARSFLAEALCDAAPRLLGAVEPKRRGPALIGLWNAGEKLVSKPVWLNRYLAARMGELTDLDGFEPFLVRVISEGIDEGPASSWKGPFVSTLVDTSLADPWFLPGIMHLATPAIVCCHDQHRDDRQVALLLRRNDAGGPLCLGSTPCLDQAGGAVEHKLSMTQQAAVVQAAANGPRSVGLPPPGTIPHFDPLEILASRTGFAAVVFGLTQRVRIVESAA